MQTLLDAIQEGRLIELPENGKERALQILASLIEAVPSLPPETDVTGAVANRERSGNTALGLVGPVPTAGFRSTANCSARSAGAGGY